MRTNPGGQLNPDHIWGRGELIARMWSVLEGRSVYMNDLRRIGKTQIMVKMHAEPRSGWTVIKFDLGGTHTAADFATLVYKQSAMVFDGKKRVWRTMQDLLGNARGSEIVGVIKLSSGVPAPWTEVLRRTFADIQEAMVAQGSDQRLVFFWDEIPFLLDNIAKSNGERVAMEVLDLLRSLGQDHDRVRLLLTGSIGIHHVLGDLRNSGYNGSPLNRMELIQPGPLAPVDGVALADALLRGGGFTSDDLAACAAAIAEAVGHVPYYIHKLISRLTPTVPLTPEMIYATLRRELLSDNNDWDFDHYRHRLKTYYPNDELVVLAILDALAIDGPLSFSEIRNQVNAQQAVGDEALRDLLKRLCQDHYLVRDDDNAYRFYLEIIRRWWRLDRSL